MSKSIFELYGTNEKAEAEGVWLDLEEVRIKVKSTGKSNKSFVNAMTNYGQRFKKNIEKGRTTAEMEKELISAYAQHVVTDWDGEAMVDKNGSPLTCDFPTKVDVLTKLPVIFHEVVEFATDYKNFQEKAVEDTAKN